MYLSLQAQHSMPPASLAREHHEYHNIMNIMIMNTTNFRYQSKSTVLVTRVGGAMGRRNEFTTRHSDTFSMPDDDDWLWPATAFFKYFLKPPFPFCWREIDDSATFFSKQTDLLHKNHN